MKHYIVVISWVFDEHVKESWNYTVSETLKGKSLQNSSLKPPVSISGRRCKACAVFCAVSNLTAGTEYEVAVWAHTDDGDSPTALSRQQTKGTRPVQPSLKARALNQTAVDCNWTGPPAEVRLELCFHLVMFFFSSIIESLALKRIPYGFYLVLA